MKIMIRTTINNAIEILTELQKVKVFSIDNYEQLLIFDWIENSKFKMLEQINKTIVLSKKNFVFKFDRATALAIFNYLSCIKLEEDFISKQLRLIAFAGMLNEQLVNSYIPNIDNISNTYNIIVRKPPNQ